MRFEAEGIKVVGMKITGLGCMHCPRASIVALARPGPTGNPEQNIALSL